MISLAECNVAINRVVTSDVKMRKTCLFDSTAPVSWWPGLCFIKALI